MQQLNNTNLAILICSFDGYSSLWKPHAEAINKFWPECPYKIFIGTNHKDSNIKWITPLKIGNDYGWSDNVRKCITKIDAEYILLFHDDLFISKAVDNLKLTKLIGKCINNKWNYLRIHNSPKGNVYYDELISEILPESIYRTSVVSAIFKKEILIDLLRDKENAWDFEINGSRRSKIYKDFYAVNDDYFSLINTVVKGKADPISLKKAKDIGLNVSEVNIPIMNLLEVFLLYSQRLLRKTFFFFLPESLKSKLIFLKNYIFLHKA